MASPQPSNPLDRYSLPTAMSSSRRRGGGGSAASPSSPSAPITEQLPLVTSPNTSEKRYFRTTEEALEQMQDVLRRRQERRNNQHVGLGVVAGSSSQGRPFDPLAGQRAIADNSVYSARSTGKGGGGAVALIGQKKTEMYNHRHQDDFARRNLHGLTASLSLRTEQYLADPSPIARTSGDETSTHKQTSTSSPAAAHESKQQQQLVMEKSSQTTTSTTTNAADATALHAAQRSLVFSDGLGGGNTSPGDPQVVPNQAPSPVMLVDERRQHKQKPSAAAAAAASTYVPHPFPHQQQEQNMVITKKASSARDAKAVVPQSQQRQQQQNVHPSNLTTAPLGTSIGDADDTADRLFATLSMLDQALKLKKYELEHQKLSLLSGTGGRGGREREGDDASLARASGSFSIPAAGDDGGKAFLPPPPVLSSLNAGLTQPTNSARSVSRRAAASPSPATRHHRDPIQINQDRGAGGGDDGRPKSPSPTIVEAPPPRSAMAVEAPRLSTARHHSMEQSGDGADLLGGRRSSSEGNKSTPGSFGSSSGNLQPPAPPQLDGSPTTQLPSSSASPPERVNRRRGPSHDLQPVAAVPLLQSSHRLLLRASASRKSSTSSKKNQPSTPKHQSSSNGGDDIGSSSSSIAATPLQPQAPHILADLRCRSPIVHAAAMTF